MYTQKREEKRRRCGIRGWLVKTRKTNPDKEEAEKPQNNKHGSGIFGSGLDT